jgi:Kef-type K+ transport system membrane component KefB
MTGITLLLIGAALGHGVARWLRLPAIPLLISAGILLRLVGAVPTPEVLEDTLVLGLMFLLFVAGIELNPGRVGAQRAAALRIGLAQFFILGGVGFGAAVLMGMDLATANYVALALTASSTLVVVRLLQRRQQMFEPFGRLVLGVLLLQDLLVIVLLPVVVGLPEGIGRAAAGLAGALLLVGIAYVFLRWITPLLVLRLGLDTEGTLLVVLTVLFGFIGLAALLQLPLVAGAFLAGVSLSRFPVSGVVRAPLTSFGDFFLALFFTAFGALITLPSLDLLVRAFVLALVVVVVTPPLVVAIAERSGLSARPSIEAGLLLAQTSELSLIVALQGWSAGHLAYDVFLMVALVTVLTMVLAPFVTVPEVVWSLMRWHPLRQEGAPSSVPRGHVLLLGCGDNGMPLLETLLSSGYETVVVDDDPAVVSRLREAEVACIRGDGADHTTLDAAGAAHARLIISTLRRPSDAMGVLRRVKDVPVLVRVFDPADADRIREAGGTPILYSSAAVEDFLAWLDQAEGFGIHRERRQRPREGA